MEIAETFFEALHGEKQWQKEAEKQRFSKLSKKLILSSFSCFSPKLKVFSMSKVFSKNLSLVSKVFRESETIDKTLEVLLRNV